MYCILHDLTVLFFKLVCVVSIANIFHWGGTTYSIKKLNPGAGDSKIIVSELCYDIQKLIPAFLQAKLNRITVLFDMFRNVTISAY